MSIKTQRLANVFVKEISDILLNEIKDKDINFVTITHIDITNDLSFAKVYFTSLDDSKREKCISELNHAKGFIRNELIKRKIQIRKMPELRFIYDESIEYANKLEKIIDEIKKEEK